MRLATNTHLLLSEQLQSVGKERGQLRAKVPDECGSTVDRLCNVFFSLRKVLLGSLLESLYKLFVPGKSMLEAIPQLLTFYPVY